MREELHGEKRTNSTETTGGSQPGTPAGEDERRWHKALKRLGAVNVRRKLQQHGDEPATMGIVADAPHPPRRFVDEWYRGWQERHRRSKNIGGYVLAVLALVAMGLFFLTMH